MSSIPDASCSVFQQEKGCVLRVDVLAIGQSQRDGAGMGKGVRWPTRKLSTPIGLWTLICVNR
jgi:hypothetical protein